MSVIDDMYKVLPYRIRKRIKKTGEARSGDEIHKRRNSRAYRVILQYNTWKKIKGKSTESTILEEYKNGYIVMISPEEYFGKDYPKKNSTLEKDFKLGKTGFVYYTNIKSFREFTPLKTWKELYELNTAGKAKDDNTWIGEYCLNIKNARPKLVSDICKKGEESKAQAEEIHKTITSYGIKIEREKVPKQCGIGNYDYDYADDEMIENVRLQMLYLLLVSEKADGSAFKQYIKRNHKALEIPDEDKTFIKNVTGKNYDKLFDDFLEKLRVECREKGLLEEQRLSDINVWDIKAKRTICPLCNKAIKIGEYFQEILQAEGRQVSENTQREIVLMHVKALRSGELNHRTYNLGWGHNYCNLIQGDKDIKETIDILIDVVRTNQKHTRMKSKFEVTTE